MRLLRLSYLAYGPFTNLVVDLGDGKGMHVLHGPNEAGKSSALRGLLAFLFGIPENTGDGFLHDNSRLRVGAAVRGEDGTCCELVRRKGRKDTLLLPSGKPAPEDALARLLGGIDQRTFTRHFALDHECLRAGSDDILMGGGQLGASLLSGALGTGVNRLLDTLDAEAGALFAPRAKISPLNRALADYDGARAAIRERQLPVATWTSRAKDLDDVVARRGEVTEELGKASKELARLTRLRDILPRLAERKRLRTKIAGLGETVPLREGYAAEHDAAAKQQEKASTMLQRTTEELAGHEAELRTVPDDQPLLERATEIEALQRQLGSHEKAAKDRHSLCGQREATENEARLLLRDLWPDADLDQIEALMPTLPRRSLINDLAGEGHKLASAIIASEERLADLDATLARAAQEQAGLPTPANTAPLRHALEEAQPARGMEVDLAEARAELQRRRGQATVELRRLDLGELALEQAEQLAVPQVETCRRFRDESDAAKHESEQLAKVKEKLQDSLRNVARQREELRLAGGVPTEEQLVAARRVRDDDWTQVRGALLEGTLPAVPPKGLADGFERKLQHADALSDRLRREAERVARSAALASQEAAHHAELATVEAALAEDAASKDRLDTAWTEAWSGSGITPKTPREMEEWLGRHTALVALAATIRELGARVDLMAERLAGYRRLLETALAEAGEVAPAPDRGLGDLLRQARDVLDRIEHAERSRDELARRVRELNVARAHEERDLNAARRRMADWQARWSEATSGLVTQAADGPNAVIATLERLAEIAKKRGAAVEKAKRIDDIDGDASAFRAAVHALVTDIAPDLAAASAELAVARLKDRLDGARACAARRAGLETQITARRTERAKAERELRESEAVLARLAAEAGTDVPGIPQCILRATEAAQLAETLERLEQDIVATAQSSVEEAEEQAAEVDRDELPASIALLARSQEELAQADRTLSEEIGRKTAELEKLDGSSQAAQAAEDAQDALAKIRKLASDYFTLRLARELLRRQVDGYLAENKDPIMVRAGELFRRLTLGSFSGVAEDVDDRDERVIVGVRAVARGAEERSAGAGRVLVAEMSDGTRDQLHLATRLAAIERHLEKSEPMPLILDDALVHFDDERARAGLEILADLSARTQVIFFTHHAQLVNLAQQVGGDRVRIQELPGRRAASGSEA